MPYKYRAEVVGRIEDIVDLLERNRGLHRRSRLQPHPPFAVAGNRNGAGGTAVGRRGTQTECRTRFIIRNRGGFSPLRSFFMETSLPSRTANGQHWSTNRQPGSIWIECDLRIEGRTGELLKVYRQLGGSTKDALYDLGGMPSRSISLPTSKRGYMSRNRLHAATRESDRATGNGAVIRKKGDALRKAGHEEAAT